MASDQVVNIDSLTVNAVAVTGITSVTYTEAGETVMNKADGEMYASAQLMVSATVEGSIDGIDQESAANVGINVAGSIIATGTRVSDGVVVTLTISNCLTLSINPTLAHAADGSFSLSFSATAPDGQTSPVVWSAA